ncbi:MAG: Trehalose utilization [Phycisphaerales bacterium]|nr:Trehalose utilization [Phycisphaerales bacterium]
MRISLILLTLFMIATPLSAADAPPPPKKIVLIAGKKSHGPEGNGIHDYNWSARLLKTALDRSNVKDQINVEVHLNGWPKDDKSLANAATIMIISDGRDGDKYSEALHLESPERVAAVQKLMDNGVGLVLLHFATFAPDQYAKECFEWTGGYFDWEENGQRKWYSNITTLDNAEVQLAAPDHPISRGVKPFRMKEEFYYNIRFAEDDKSLTPLLTVPALKGREKNGNTVAWCRERTDKGRGFATTCGHFYDNWKNDDFRKLVLNALAWTAHVEVPKGGIDSQFPTREEIEKAETNARE